MKKIGLILCLTLGIVLLSGCLSSYVSTKQVMKIRQGMTQEQVTALIGKPDYRRFDDSGKEEWEYRRDSGTLVVNQYPVIIIIGFIDGKVVAMNTFEDVKPPLPHGQH